MYSKSQVAFKYLQYYLTASSGKGHGIHSPFVFEFITKILNDKKRYPAYEEIEKMRSRLLKDNSLITINELGAGSSISNTNTRTVESIARHAAKSRKFGQLLYRIVRHYSPHTILELGTSLGITTSYLATANPGARLITMEGVQPIADLAKENFKALGLSNITVTEGNFDDTLAPVVRGLSAIDFSFIDGNHRLEPTIQYFKTILAKTGNFSIIVLDDIHWSREMEGAWNYCKEHSSVTLSIDLFFIGILFFRKEIKEKQHFTIRF